MTQDDEFELDPELENNEELDPVYRVVVQRAKEWIRELIDYSRRNNLLYFRETKKQHLDLTHSESNALNLLIDGQSVSLDQLFPGDELEAGFLPDALSRLKTIKSKAKENFEERSISTLYLATWECSWDDSKRSSNRQPLSGSERIPRAPLFLAPIEIKQGARQGEFRLSLVGDWEVNPALKSLMRSEWGIELDEIEGDGSEDFDFLEEYRRRIEEAPGGEVRWAAQISNFSYAKYAMVEDLQEGLADLAANQMILAICGNESALSEIRGNLVDPPIDKPNQIEPKIEYLILDADSSQNQVINAILDGQSFAFDGPPGTGKSQTIANAIGALIAEGKKVLFVAEKRAAIEAVVKRLSDQGLTDLLMDFHGTGKKKKEVLADLRQACEAVRVTETKTSRSGNTALTRERQKLLDHSQALHQVRKPFDRSLYDLMVIAAAHEVGSDVRFRFPTSVRSSMKFEDIERCEDLIRELGGLGGFLNDPGLAEWRKLDNLDPEVVEDDISSLGDLVDEYLPAISESFDEAVTELTKSKLAFVDKEELVVLAHEILEFQSSFGAAIFAEDVVQLVADLESARSRIGRIIGSLFNSRYRSTKKKVRALTQNGGKPPTLLALVEDAFRLKDRWTSLERCGLDRDVIDLRSVKSIGKLGLQISQLAQCRVRFEKFSTLSEGLETDLDEALNRAELLLRAANYARTAHDARRVEAELEQLEISRLIEEMKGSPDDLPRLVDMLWYSWSTSIVESMGSRVLGLTKTSSDGLTEAVSVFRELDKKHIEDTPARIRAIWAKQFSESVKDFEEEWNSLSAALNRKRSLPGIRTVFNNSSSVVSALKPCWVMSPLSVSMLRPPVGWFDVVIFDEASQILPADAITSIKAARQVVVAGDDRQLPPTTFFAGGENDDLDDEDSKDESINVGHYESILSLMKYIITKPRELRWHYRSRDERLIAFSNEKLYKSLITFPDSAEDSCLRFVRVENGERSISKRASNPAEVDCVVDLIREHAMQRPEESLGVIALGSPHANAIEDALWEAARSDEVLAEFLELHREEPFFVKNLERVQGDERDAIILTIGYGRNQRGEIVYNFGPINGRFGERRLNVAVTRSKNRMTLVSTFSHVELDEKKCKSGGLPFMRDYLRYVETDGTEFGDSSVLRPEMNAFERSIYTRLTELGYRVVPQYGIGRYRVDFAVVSPEDPTRFVLAVECDGASYHSQPTARERDRLRQEALERRGWRFHRIWSTDWFRDPEGELQKCVLSINAAAQGLPNPTGGYASSYQEQLFEEDEDE
jgi:very-short-patch-repair endonuclease